MSAPPRSWTDRVELAVVVALALAFSVQRLQDFDVWYHLAAGRLIWTTGRWPTANTLAFIAADHPWIDLHWLFQLLLYGAHQLAGINGCIALAAALVTITVVLLYGLARRFVPPLIAALLVAVAVTVASPRFVPRPELVSFVLFALYLRLLEGYPQNGRAIWWLVPLQVIWVNVQGIFAVGLALIACYWAGATIAVYLPVPQGWRASSRLAPAAWRRLTAVLVLAVAGCLVNPYGLAGALFPLELLPRVTGGSFLSQRIGEFRGPFASGYARPLAWAWAALLGANALLLALTVRRWHLGRTLALLAFGFLGAQSLRNMAFAAWIAVPGIAAQLAALRETMGRRRAPSIPPPWSRALEWVGIGAILVLAAGAATNRVSRALGVENEFGLGVSAVRFSPEAVDFLRRAGIGGRPFNCLAMGGFLAWHRYPDEQVFVDGRLEAFPEDALRSYFAVMDDPRAWPELADAQHFDYAFLLHLWGNRLPLAGYLARGHGWTLVYYDAVTSIFVPDDEAHREMRERAQRTFAELARRRGDLFPDVTTTPLAFPIAAVWRGRSLGGFLSAMGDQGQAIRVYERTLGLDPESSDTRYALGLAYWYAGQRDAALRAWQEVLRRDPDNSLARHALATTARQ